MGNAKKRERKRKEWRNTFLITGFLGLLFFTPVLFTVWVRNWRMDLTLIPVNANEVCMLDDVYTPTNNYPLAINNTTYYCCEKECREYFEKPGFSIYAIDPFSKVQVNKASAVYGRTANGSILYFKNIENLLHYQSS